MPTGVELIEEERERQIVELGYDALHDTEHDGEQMAFAAACYAAPETIYLLRVDEPPALDPQGGYSGAVNGAVRWQEPWPGWRREPRGQLTAEERIDELVKAGALIAAEIDRIQAAWGLTDDDLGVE